MSTWGEEGLDLSQITGIQTRTKPVCFVFSFFCFVFVVVLVYLFCLVLLIHSFSLKKLRDAIGFKSQLVLLGARRKKTKDKNNCISSHVWSKQKETKEVN